MCLEPIGAHLVHDAQPLTEANQAADDVVKLARPDELVAAAEGREDTLSNVAVVAVGLDQLEVFMLELTGPTTLDADEHGAIMLISSQLSRKSPSAPVDIGTTFPSPQGKHAQ